MTDLGSPLSNVSLLLGSLCTFLVQWMTLLICKSILEWALAAVSRLLAFALRLFALALRLAFETLATLCYWLLCAILHASCQCNHFSLGPIALFSVAMDPHLYLLLRPASCFFGPTVFLTEGCQRAPSFMVASLAFVHFMCVTPIHAFVALHALIAPIVGR